MIFPTNQINNCLIQEFYTWK